MARRATVGCISAQTAHSRLVILSPSIFLVLQNRFLGGTESWSTAGRNTPKNTCARQSSVKGSINTRPTPRANMEEDGHALGASADAPSEATPMLSQMPAAGSAGSGTTAEHAEPSSKTRGATEQAEDHSGGQKAVVDLMVGANDSHKDGSANLLSSPSRHWKLCEIIAAVRACLAVQERSGDSSASDRKPHVNAAYAQMCKQLQDEGKWDDFLTVEQSIQDRCVDSSQGDGRASDTAVHVKFVTIARECRNTIMEVYKQCMAKCQATGTYIIVSGGNEESTLNAMADKLWSKHGPSKYRQGPRSPEWIYKPFEIFKIFGPKQIGGEGATLFLEDAIAVGRSSAATEGALSRSAMRIVKGEGGSSVSKVDSRARSVQSPSPLSVDSEDGNADIVKQLHFKNSMQSFRESKEIEATVKKQQLVMDHHQQSIQNMKEAIQMAESLGMFEEVKSLKLRCIELMSTTSTLAVSDASKLIGSKRKDRETSAGPASPN